MIKELKKYIINSGLKKSKVAEKLGCSSGHLSYILNGHRVASLELENRIKELLK